MKNNDNNQKHQVADIYINDRKQIEKLRVILEKEQGRPFTYKEAQKIGTDLIELYKVLAGGRKITMGGLKNEKEHKKDD